MAIPSIYINLEDDVSKITTRLARQTAKQAVLVCPKKCFLFSDPLNLKLLKEQTDLLGKELFVLTMDEKGQQYAEEAGFQLKFLPKVNSAKTFSDVKVPKRPAQEAPVEAVPAEPGILAAAVQGIKDTARRIVPAAILESKVIEKQPLIPESQQDAPLQASETFFPDEIRKDYEAPKVKSRMPKIIMAVVAVSLILILLLFFVVLPKATVVVYAKREPVTRDMDVSASGQLKAIDTAKLAIPATPVSEAVIATDKFQSQGKKQIGNRATGTVRIYNFTKQPINLKSATTILSIGGKNYNFISDISGLKPTTYKNAQTKEVNQASLAAPLEVIAAEGGEDYNLPAGTRVEITNQVFGSNPQLLYAKTDSEIKGGTTRYLSVISQEDAALAKTQLEQKALAQVREKLSATGLVLPDKAFAFESEEFAPDNPIGTEAPVFQGALQIKVTGLAFKKTDLSDLITKRINETLAANKTLQVKNPENTVYTVKSLDMANQLLVLAVHFEGQAIYNLNLPYIAPELVGKTQNQVNEILRSKAEIDRVDITLAPAWQKNFPFFAGKINVSISQDQP